MYIGIISLSFLSSLCRFSSFSILVKGQGVEKSFSYFVKSLKINFSRIQSIRFVKLEDKKGALVSRLLQYALVNQVLGIPFDDIVIRRTPEGKPFLV